MTQRAFEAWTPASKVILLVIASRPELEAVSNACGFDGNPPADAWKPVLMRPGVEVLLTGVGKANAAAATARALDAAHHALVISMGVGGALPRENLGPLAAGQTIAGSMSLFADEGVQTPASWISMAELGFPLVKERVAVTPDQQPHSPAADGIASDPAALALASGLCDHTAPIATVSVCSGTDQLAMQTARRTHAWVEAMEGAAAGLVANKLEVPFVEIRVISNQTGDRDRQAWDIGLALKRLGQLAQLL